MKKVEFVPRDIDAFESVMPPHPASKYIPDWYKKIPPYHDETNSLAVHKPAQPTAKKCIPFLDGFMSGYIQELWCDVYIDEEENKMQALPIKYSWAGQIRPIDTRRETNGVYDLLPRSEYFYPVELQWQTQWEPKLPNGYSALYTHPLSRYDLPFFTLSGVIDTDAYPIAGPIPFFIKKGFKGIIPAGTPLYQIIPIKRESWKASDLSPNDFNSKKVIQSVKRFYYGGYKKMIWQRKEYL